MQLVTNYLCLCLSVSASPLELGALSPQFCTSTLSITFPDTTHFLSAKLNSHNIGTSAFSVSLSYSRPSAVPEKAISERFQSCQSYLLLLFPYKYFQDSRHIPP